MSLCGKKETAGNRNSPISNLQSNLETRRARPEDADVIARFNVAMAQETEDKALDASTVRRGVRRLLEQPSDADGFYLVAEREGEIAGALMITTEWSDWRAARFWWIQSVYVHPEARRQGVFRALYARVRGEAERRDDVCGLRLYVEQGNDAARAAYEKLGMDETHYAMYEEALS
jgi:ribosomal protein S18 acetylase RimI-like enzyme